MVEVKLVIIDNAAYIDIAYLDQTITSHIRTTADIYMSVAEEIETIVNRMKSNAVENTRQRTIRGSRDYAV